MILKHISLVLVTALATATCLTCSAGATSAPHVRDSAAAVIVSSPSGTRITLSGTLMVGYKVLPTAVIVHGKPVRKQRYLYLHLTKPIDFIDVQTTWKSIFHQYDIQVIDGSSTLDANEAASLSRTMNSLVGKPVLVSGRLAPPGYNPGSPDWEPFPLTIFINTIGLGAAAKN